MIKVLDRLAGEAVNVAVFPECALTGYSTRTLVSAGQDVGAAEDKIRQTCARRRIAAVFGSTYTVNGHSYDSAVVFDSQGQLVERYGKVMLAGEKWAIPGNHVAFFDLEGVASTLIICHDERYPELVRLPALAGARMIYYVSSESSILQESKLAPYRAQMMARAVENNMYVVAANAPANPSDNSGSHGQSRIIANDGRVLKEASFFGEDVLTETINVRPGKLERPLEGLLGKWWRDGVTWMMENRRRPLD